ncbi:MAG: ATP-dependent Clp protease ATP-binding subunit [Anaerolineae bacterium]|nr:ATP-dependent Clp protease ATP-binding subunit [Anaerolineae bacterium]
MSKNSMERFTQRARRVLSLAQDEAERMQHSYIGTEHLLMGLIREEGGVAGRVLRDLGLEPRRVEDLVQRMTRADKRTATDERLDLSPGTKRVLELAVDEARRMEHHYIGTEHLLLGLVRSGEGVAIDVLKRLGVSPEEIKRHTRRVLQDNSSATSASTPSSRASSEGDQGGTEPQRPSSRRRGGSDTKTPLVDQLATDLTSKAEAGELDPVIGRDTEIERVIQILSRRNKNNPALIGEPGVGKTAIVEGLAQRIVNLETPRSLHGKRVLQLDVGSLVAGTMYRGQFEERLKRVIDELKASDSILFIDEVHMLVGAGAAGSSVDAANILKPALARGELQCIGATTFDEYRKHIESDAALERRFQPVNVEEPSVDETIAILQGIRPNFEEHHNLDISDEALDAAANLSARYVTDRFMPDKAIDLVDEGAARVRMYKSPEALRVRKLEARIETLKKNLSDYVDDYSEEELDEFRQELTVAEQDYAGYQIHWDKDTQRPRMVAEDVAEVVSMLTGIPVTQIAGEEGQRLLQMEEVLRGRIVGQEEAIQAISKAVRRARAGLKDPRRPIGSFIFLGPTGVGKTELTKSLAEFLFGSEDALIQLDMSEFMERHNVARLVGAPPGYVGYEEAGQLTEAIRRRPYSIVVFDEIEKAHPEAFNMLLQIMEEGHLSDARGRKVDFRNAIIIMTSNIGADTIKKGPSLGFGLPVVEGEKGEEQGYSAMRKTLMDQLRRAFRPEFLNRLDAVIVFRSLTQDDITHIVDLRLDEVRQRLLEHAIMLEVTPPAKEFLARQGYDPEYGARPLRRVITNLVEDRLSDRILGGEFSLGATVVVDFDEEHGELTFKELENAEPEPSA